MMTQRDMITVFICDDAAKAAQAKADLEEEGYEVVLAEATRLGTCDAATYDSGGNHPFQDKWVVVGRLPPGR